MWSTHKVSRHHGGFGETTQENIKVRQEKTEPPTRQTPHVDPLLVRCRVSVYDAGPALYQQWIRRAPAHPNAVPFYPHVRINSGSDTVRHVGDLLLLNLPGVNGQGKLHLRSLHCFTFQLSIQISVDATQCN